MTEYDVSCCARDKATGQIVGDVLQVSLTEFAAASGLDHDAVVRLVGEGVWPHVIDDGDAVLEYTLVPL